MGALVPITTLTLTTVPNTISTIVFKPVTTSTDMS
jgi:hypothetical protein